MKSLFASIVFLIAFFVVGCDPSSLNGGGGPYYKQDVVSVSGAVYGQHQGSSVPYSGLNINSYRWFVTFTDGFTLIEDFFPGLGRALMTDLNGLFSFSSGDLNLQNSYTTYETVTVPNCTRFCAEWDVDEDGFEYCVWEDETCDPYTYDVPHTETDYYSIANIAHAYSQIEYDWQSSHVITVSDAVTTSGFINEELWRQDDEFFTPVELTTASGKPGVQKNLKKRHSLVNGKDYKRTKHTEKALRESMVASLSTTKREQYVKWRALAQKNSKELRNILKQLRKK